MRSLELVHKPAVAPSCCDARPKTFTVAGSRLAAHGGAGVALVNVPYGASGSPMRPLGLAYLGAYLLSEGIECRGFDMGPCALQEMRQFVLETELHKYPVVGLSFYNTNALIASQLAQLLKALNPDVLILAGGPHPSASYEQLLLRHSEIDVVVKNEGELATVALIRALLGNGHVEQLDGVTYRCSDHLHTGSDPQRLDDLDSLPAPVFDFISPVSAAPMEFFDQELGRSRRATALVTSRSCPYNCSFCAIILIGRKWRAASPNKVVADLAALEAHRGTEFEHVYFLDANFFVNATRTLEVAEALQQYRPGITFSFSTRANQLVRGSSLLPELRKRGLRAVEVGIESGSQAALKRYAKDTTPRQNDEAIKILRDNQLRLLLDFIMFDAPADLDDLRDNIEFLTRNGLDLYVPWDHLFSHLTPYLGTRIRDEYETLLPGVTFDDDCLPDPESLLVDPRVREVFHALMSFRPYLLPLAKALSRLEEKANNLSDRELARTLLNAGTLRRLPFVVLRNLIKQASGHEPVDLELAIPVLFDDNGRSVSLQSVISYALS